MAHIIIKHCQCPQSLKRLRLRELPCTISLEEAVQVLSYGLVRLTDNYSAIKSHDDHRSDGPKTLNYLTQSCLQTELSNSDQDGVKIVVPKFSSNSFIKQSNIAEGNAVHGSADQNQMFVLRGHTAVNGSANQNLPFSEIGVEYYSWRQEGNP